MSSVTEPVGEIISASVPTLELHEIQATVLRPRPAPYFGTHVLLRVDDPKAGRAFLRRIIPYVDSATGWRIAANAWMDIAISYAGLKALGVPEESLQSFPETFRVGMAARARELNDEGVNDPKNWDAPFGTGQVHIGVSAFTDSEEKHRRVLAIARDEYEGFSGVTLLASQDFGAQPGERTAHPARRGRGADREPQSPSAGEPRVPRDLLHLEPAGARGIPGPSRDLRRHRHGQHDAQADRDGARPRNRLFPVRGVTFPRGARPRTEKTSIAYGHPSSRPRVRTRRGDPDQLR